MGAETLTALRSELERVLLGKSGGPYDSQTLPTKVCCYCLFVFLPVRHARLNLAHLFCVAGARPLTS
jgi:hypothetical protein